MKSIIKTLSVMCVLAAALMFSPPAQTSAQALGAGLQATAEKTESVTAVHYRYYRHHHRYYGYPYYYRRHHHHRHHYYRHHHRHHHGVRVRIYL
jgi:hypothetical protein